MTMFPLAGIAGSILGLLMAFLSLFLVMLILIQRGKGGGLTGALGGPGGQSAFGSKAGDTFTHITIGVALIWGFTCAFTMWLLGTHSTTADINTPSIEAGPGDDSTSDPTPLGGSGFGIGGGELPPLGTPGESMSPLAPGGDFAPAGDPGSGDTSDAGEADGETATDDDAASGTPEDAAKAAADDSEGDAEASE